MEIKIVINPSDNTNDEAGDSAAYDAGFAEGEKQGMTMGMIEGYNDGFADGEKQGMTMGLIEGYNDDLSSCPAIITKKGLDIKNKKTGAVIRDARLFYNCFDIPFFEVRSPCGKVSDIWNVEEWYTIKREPDS